MSIKRNILLNPGPATTTDSVKMALVVPDICPREEEFGQLMKKVRTGLVNVVATEDSHTAVLFTCSGTGGVEACISSAVPDQGKILIVNNGAYGARMAEIALRYYGKERVISYTIPFGDYPNLQDIESLLKEHKDITSLGVIHHETTSGMLNPIREIGALAHRYGSQMIVDAMSSYAGIPISMEEDNIDYLVSSSNKCIQGMPGMFFVILSHKTLASTKDYTKQNLYFNLWEQHEYFDRSGQMRYTPPVQVVYALKQAIDEFYKETPEARYARYRKSWETLMAGMEQMGFKTLLAREHQSALLTTFFEPQDEEYSFDDMHDYLIDRGFTIYPGKISSSDTFRLANIGQIEEGDIRNFLKALDSYRKGC